MGGLPSVPESDGDSDEIRGADACPARLAPRVMASARLESLLRPVTGAEGGVGADTDGAFVSFSGRTLSSSCPGRVVEPARDSLDNTEALALSVFIDSGAPLALACAASTESNTSATWSRTSGGTSTSDS